MEWLGQARFVEPRSGSLRVQLPFFLFRATLFHPKISNSSIHIRNRDKDNVGWKIFSIMFSHTTHVHYRSKRCKSFPMSHHFGGWSILFGWYHGDWIFSMGIKVPNKFQIPCLKKASRKHLFASIYIPLLQYESHLVLSPKGWLAHLGGATRGQIDWGESCSVEELIRWGCYMRRRGCFTISILAFSCGQETFRRGGL